MYGETDLTDIFLSRRRIHVESTGETTLTADQAAVIVEKRLSFLLKLKRFRQLQRIYMPAAAEILATQEAARDPDALPPRAEDIKIWFPSDLGIATREGGCHRGLVEMEAKLREAQCADALTTLRTRLHAKSHLILFRNANMVGQMATTRSRSLISAISDRITACAAKYRRSREALISLRGPDMYKERFLPLLPSDLQMDAPDTSDIAARQRLSRAGGNHGPRATNSAQKVLSWIWTVEGGPSLDDNAALHVCTSSYLHRVLFCHYLTSYPAVRVEWAKARACMMRWKEEVHLLREEMRRVLRFLEWRVTWWETREVRWEGISKEVGDGQVAYAARQAALHREIALSFKTKWDVPAALAARHAVLANDTGLDDTFFSRSVFVFISISMSVLSYLYGKK